MEFKDVCLELRKKAGLSQNELAEKLFVTRQAVSRWEQGETIPEIETLQAMSQLFNVSINTLLGKPQVLICQSCGMPLHEEVFARNQDGSMNESYCKWCWTDGDFVADCSMEDMIEQCVPHMPGDPDAVRSYLKELLPTLDRWKKV